MNVARWSKRYRSIWVSDVHIGTKACKAELLLDFLRWHDCDNLYLVGDIVDGWRLRRNWFWVPAYNDLLQTILQMAKQGTRIVYVPGNHDEGARAYCDLELEGICIQRDAVHELADGRKFLIIHGDEFDGVVNYARWLAFLGDYAYRTSLLVNRWFNYGRKVLGLPYWSLSAYLKHAVKNAVDFICDFENAVADEARRRGLDGVICGHVHHAQIRDIDGITYCNDGDWVESCTALVEHHDGTLEIIHWADAVQDQQMSLAS